MKIIFEFIGGSHDGHRDEGEQARALYLLTEDGTVGRQIQGLTDHTAGLIQELGRQGFVQHVGPCRKEKYEVVERLVSEFQLV